VAERRTHPNGGTYERGPDGQWHLVSGPNPMNNPFVDPRLAPQVTKAQNEAIASQNDPAKAAADVKVAEAQARIAEANAAVISAKNSADLQIAQANLAKAQAELQKMQTGKGAALNALQSQVDRVGELYRKELKGGLPNALNNIIPWQSGKDAFDSAAQGLTNPFQAAFKVEGQGSQSDTELRQFLEANTPAQGDSDAVIEEKLGNIQRRIDAERGTLGQQPPAPPQGPAPDKVGLANGATRSEIDPVLKAAGQRVGRMIADGVPNDRILDFLQRSGIDPASTNINQALQHRTTKQFKDWQRANPGKAYPIGPDFYTREIPMSSARQIMNKASQSAPAAFAASAGNAVTGGRLDNIVGSFGGDPEMARTGMQLLRSQNPGMSFAGDMAGQAMTEMTVGRIPGIRGLTATRWGRRGNDLAYGAYSGSGEADGNAGMGALTGALANATGGMLGRSVQRGGGRALTGVRNANLGYLNNADVPLTIGQIGRGSDNVVGHAVGGIEERFAGLPIADAIIGSARRRGDEGFNAAAFREAGGTGITGSHGVVELHGNVNDAYSFLDPIRLPYDAPFAGGQAAVRATLPRNLGAGVADRMDNIDNAVVNGSLSGRSWQDSLRGVRADRASLRGEPFSDQAINSLNNIEGNLQGLALRHGPPGTAANLQNANQRNAQFQTIVSALDNGPTQRADELFSASRLDAASRQGANQFGGQVASIEGNRPFYNLTRAGMEVMPNLTPDSGTAGRSIFYASLPAVLGGGAGAAYGGLSEEGSAAESGATGAGAGAAATIIPTLALAGLYSRAGQRGLQRAMLGPRNETLVRIGDRLINFPRMGGMFGSSVMRDLFLQEELGQ
jgi:hypothetical protein